MAPHSSTLAWKIPRVEEHGRLQSMGSLGVGYGWATSLWLFTFMHWRRKWQPTPVFLPGESQGQGAWWACCLWGCTELDMTEATQQQQARCQTLKVWRMPEVAPQIINRFPNACSKECSFAFSRLSQGEEDLRLEICYHFSLRKEHIKR